MKDLLGRKTALEQTLAIIKTIPAQDMSTNMYRAIVEHIYANQLKKHTTLNRFERRFEVKRVFSKRGQNGTL